jgi:hypothetical protein
MAVPNYNIYISFGAGSSVDVTSYAGSMSITRGGSRVFEDVQPGTINISFNNFDRTFDPFNTSSILWDSTNGYSRVQPNAKVRVYANNSYIIYTGWVNNWSFTNDEKGLNPQASLSATDGLGILGNAKFNAANITSANLPSMPPVRIAAATAAWGGTAITVTQNGSAGRTPLVADTFDQSATVLSYLQNVARTEPYNFFGTTDGNAKITDRTLTGRTWGTASISYNYHVTAGFYDASTTAVAPWWATTSKGLKTDINYQITAATAGEPSYISALIDPTLTQALIVYNENNATKYLQNQAYSISFKGKNIDSSHTIFAQMAFRGANSGSSTSIPGTSTGSGWDTYKLENVKSTALADGITFQISNTTGYPFSVKDLIITPSVTASSFYFDGESYQTINDYLNEQQVVNVGWTGTERYSTSVYNVAINGGGTVNLPGYEVFGDAYGTAVVGTAIPISDLQVAYTTDQFYNQASVVRASGGTAVKNNTTSQALYSVRSYAQTDSLSISPGRSNQFASEVFGQFGVPDYVLTDVDIQLETLSSAYQNRVLNLELFDIVRVIYRPYGGGSNIDRTYQIIGIQHNVSVESHVISFGLATINSGLFLNSTYLGVLDTQKVV